MSSASPHHRMSTHHQQHYHNNNNSPTTTLSEDDSNSEPNDLRTSRKWYYLLICIALLSMSCQQKRSVITVQHSRDIHSSHRRSTAQHRFSLHNIRSKPDNNTSPLMNVVWSSIAALVLRLSLVLTDPNASICYAFHRRSNCFSSTWLEVFILFIPN